MPRVGSRAKAIRTAATAHPAARRPTRS
jgi:hypothetical protein